MEVSVKKSNERYFVIREIIFKAWTVLRNSYKQNLFKDSTLLYCSWLVHHGPSYNENTWPSFLITLTSFLNNGSIFSNSRSSFWFFSQNLKCSSVWKTRLRVLKQILSRVFLRKEFLKIWSLKSKIYSLK